ncbi:hypothetical protein [Rugamonas rivuli]|uniref:Uncharacterized protein n=1 Tax=Rugamonas rivuli TaxID=2743358 RepID=A0A843SFG3_9BURK|nr:hypothetical protein [Rugamonas rivuli]MQA20933.1 hypothetical protein [Rugamonas rivuli]
MTSKEKSIAAGGKKNAWTRAGVSVRLTRARMPKLQKLKANMDEDANPIDVIDFAINSALTSNDTMDWLGGGSVADLEESVSKLARETRHSNERLAEVCRMLPSLVSSFGMTAAPKSDGFSPAAIEWFSPSECLRREEAARGAACERVAQADARWIGTEAAGKSHVAMRFEVKFVAMDRRNLRLRENAAMPVLVDLIWNNSALARADLTGGAYLVWMKNSGGGWDCNVYAKLSNGGFGAALDKDGKPRR